MGDRNEDGMIDFGEFVAYIAEHEKKLKLAFKTLDIKKDGQHYCTILLHHSNYKYMC